MRDFDYTVNVLVKAYLNDSLIHGDCQHCAVGEIVHAAGAPHGRMITLGSCGSWKWAFYTEIGIIGSRQVIKPFGEQAFNDALKVIEPTGYSWEELARIEKEFERSGFLSLNEDEDEAMFNGLMAVVTVLAEIHGIDLETTEAARKLFIKV
jgi:hypothetical protein